MVLADWNDSGCLCGLETAEGPRLALATSADEPEAAGIDVERIERVQRELEEEEFKSDTPTFADLGIDPLLLPGLKSGGFDLPSPIQEAAVPAILRGGNCAVQSYTGSGKTFAYLLPALTLAFRRAEELYKRRGSGEGWTVQALIVAPSQELAMQIVRAARGLLPEDARPAVQQLIGGASPFRQRDALLTHRPIVVVGTPGRLAEMVRSADLQLHRCPLLILDEADQLLAANFSEDLGHVTVHAGKRLPAGRQTVLVSATLTESVLQKFERWCPAPAYVTAGGGAGGAAPHLAEGAGGGGGAAGGAAPAWGWGVTGWEGPASDAAPRTRGTAGGAEGAELVPTLPPGLRHVYVVAEPRHRVDALRRCVHALGAEKALVFMNWHQRLRDAQHKLEARNMQVACLSGEMGKQARQSVLESFTRGGHRLLLVSDVAARGLDVPGVDAVFNLELPSNAAHYAHRAGRTGRMGATGVVVSVAAPSERFVIERLSARLGVPILEAHVEGGEFIIGPPPSHNSKPKKRKPAPVAAAGDAAGAAPVAGAGAAAAQQQRGGGGGAAGGGGGGASDDEEDFEEVYEDEDDDDLESKAAASLASAQVAAASGRLDPRSLAALEGFLEAERRLGGGGGGGGEGGRGGGRGGGGRGGGGRGGGGRGGGGRGGRRGGAAARGGGRGGRRAEGAGGRRAAPAGRY
ncbi:MAG: P-loop containing nucleoside triphosphate hydrolase protein [Monoraphidium minutum]|nr:MAG: P-loop containing nucleoside triphosphate hydrolase protein [Monoraphidium minutum]